MRLPGGGLDVYTLHLTIFALMSNTAEPDLEPARTGRPQRYVNDGKLVLRWVPPAVKLEYISVWINGQAVDVLDGSTLEDYLGQAVVDDQRVFQVQAVDPNGNGSALSNKVTGVPDLTGLTVQQATDALSARGLHARQRHRLRVPRSPPEPPCAELRTDRLRDRRHARRAERPRSR